MEWVMGHIGVWCSVFSTLLQTWLGTSIEESVVLHFICFLKLWPLYMHQFLNPVLLL